MIETFGFPLFFFLFFARLVLLSFGRSKKKIGSFFQSKVDMAVRPFQTLLFDIGERERDELS